MVFHFVDMSAAFSIPGAETHDLPWTVVLHVQHTISKEKGIKGKVHVTVLC